MAFDVHANFAYSTVATAPSPALSGVSLVVVAGDGAEFPAVPFNATVWPAGVQPTTGNAEIVRVTTVATDTFTITRATENSTAQSIAVGYQIANTITNKTLTDVQQGPPIPFYENIYGKANVGNVINATVLSATPFFTPFWLEGSLSQMRSIELQISQIGTSLNITGGIAFYSAKNTTQLSLYASETYGASITTSASWSGLRQFAIQPAVISGSSLSAGLWWLGLYFFGSNSSTAVQNFSIQGITAANIVGSIFTGTNSSGATNASNQAFPMIGFLNSTEAPATPFPASVGASAISGSGSGAGGANVIYFQIIP